MRASTRCALGAVPLVATVDARIGHRPWLTILAGCLQLAMHPHVAAQTQDWRLQRFQAVAAAGEALAKQYFPNQRERGFTYVNWRHLDGDSAIDALIIVKNVKASCSLPGTRCVAAVLTTGHASSPGTLGLLGTYFPTSEPTFVLPTPQGVRLWIPENRNNYVEVLLPRQAGQLWQVTPEKRTRRMASAGGALTLDEEDFALLDPQQAAASRFQRTPSTLPAGAPFVYVGEIEAIARDSTARAVQSALDGLAAARALDTAPIIEFSRCLSGEFYKSLKEFMGRAAPSAVKARTVVVCVDEIPAGADPEARDTFRQLWDTRLWIASVQAAASYANEPLRQAGDRVGFSMAFLSSLRALSDLASFGRIDMKTAVSQLVGLSDLPSHVPSSVQMEATRFVEQVFRPMLFAYACALRDVSEVDRDLQATFADLRRKNQADCERAIQAVNAIP